jgi:hypothetical protein
MYSDDPQTTLEELISLPQCNVGSPSPQIFANEGGLLLAYLVQSEPPYWGPGAKPEAYAIVRFERPQAHLFGPPNDEAINGHPLYAKGLGPYARYRVLNSPWIRSLEQMNSVHPRHEPGRYRHLSHYIFTFHDSTFECIARNLQVQIFQTKEAVAAEITSEFKPIW